MKKVLITVLLLALCLPGAALAADGGLAVTGKVVNDTDAAAPLDGIEVSLHSYADGNFSGTVTTETDAGGAFRFEGVGAGQEHLVSAAYDDVDYYQQVIFEPGQTEAYVEIHVVEATDSDAAVSVAARHVIIDMTEATPYVTEIHRIDNSANMTYFRDTGSLAFTLPPEIWDLSVLTGNSEDYFGENGRLLYLLPLPPGESEFVFSYGLPSDEAGNYSIAFTADYPVATLEVLITGEDIEVTSPQLVPDDPVTAGDGQLFLHYTLNGLQRGDGFSLSVSRVPSGSYAWLGWLILALVIILTAWGVLSYRRRGGA